MKFKSSLTNHWTLKYYIHLTDICWRPLHTFQGKQIKMFFGFQEPRFNSFKARTKRNQGKLWDSPCLGAYILSGQN